jgi:CHASE domain
LLWRACRIGILYCVLIWTIANSTSEPVVGNEAAIDLDLYSSPTQQKTTQHPVTTWMPCVTDRLKLVQETDPSAYSIILHHPGVRLSSQNETATPTGISLMVIRVPALLGHASSDAKDAASFYIYDSTHTDDEPVFLGAHSVYPPPNTVVTFRGLPEVSLEELKATAETHFELREVAIADRTWIVGVVSLPDTYKAQAVFVVVGGFIIFMASLSLSTCFWTQMARDDKVNAIKSEAAREKAEIIVKTARQQALAERQLNEYIA